jgi:hypothetical protein
MVACTHKTFRHAMSRVNIPSLSLLSPLTDIYRTRWHIWDYGPFYGDGSSGIPDGISSIQRRWYFSPIYDINSGNMACNLDGSATKDSLHGTMTAGSMITAQFNVLNFTLTTVGKTIVITQLHL